MPPRVKNKAIKLTDPVLTGNIETDLSGDAPATPTDGPNRYTIYVPTDNATLSLGEAGPEKTRIHERGITGRTDTHVHFHVTKHAPTVLSLGGPATAFVSDEEAIPSHDPKVPKQSHGYSMVTSRSAWHDAQDQNYIVSRSCDVVLRAAGNANVTNLVQADLGTVVVSAGRAIRVGTKGTVSIVADKAVNMEDPAYEVAVAGAVRETCDRGFETDWIAYVDNLQKVILGVVAGITTYRAFRTYAKDREAGELWEGITGVAKLGIDAYQFVNFANGEVDKLKKKKEETSDVNIMAKNSAKVLGENVTAHGTMGATLSSSFSVDILGPTTGMKALLFAGIWAGAGTSVEALGNVDVGSALGNVGIEGKKNVDLCSKKASVTAVAAKNVQLGAGEKAMLHGKRQVYCGSGGSTGYGLHATADKLHLGRFTAGTNLGSPGPDDDKKVFFDSSRVGIMHGKSSVQVYTTIIKIEAKSQLMLRSNNHDIQLKGKKIRLG
ncbi:hypothetical protein [Polyangium mundeleinium]|uniref:Senescence domain-containing protein n=1 Tax=Polyangium mundeleinium TaxID=2995306 RepID=A0ABT5EIG0_9BACT|nr:hypothetical protein [Polyangium mundeleinium]MDC0741593.1 hypothetical protein [Polyangium mundeleinium]